MNAVATLTIPTHPMLNTDAAKREYIDDLADEHPALAHYRYAVWEVINADCPVPVELYRDEEIGQDGYLTGRATLLLWLPEIDRAALNESQGGDWQWTDASSPADALRRYREDEMAP